MYDEQPAAIDPIKLAAVMASENASMYECSLAAKCIRDLSDEVTALRRLCQRQQDEIGELNGMADAVERLRDIGRVVGCDHVDDPDGRRQLVNCVDQEFARLQADLDPERRKRQHYVGGLETL